MFSILVENPKQRASMHSHDSVTLQKNETRVSGFKTTIRFITDDQMTKAITYKNGVRAVKTLMPRFHKRRKHKRH